MHPKIHYAAAAALAAAAMAGIGDASQRAAQAAQELRAAIINEAPGKADRTRGVSTPSAFDAIFGRGRGHGTSAAGGYLSRAGWTNRRYQRAALKRRNKAQHRAACKRKHA